MKVLALARFYCVPSTNNEVVSVFLNATKLNLPEIHEADITKTETSKRAHKYMAID